MIGLGKKGHVQKSRNDGNDGFEGSPITKSKSYKFKMKRDNTTELVACLFYNSTIKMAQKSRKSKKNKFFYVFPDFL